MGALLYTSVQPDAEDVQLQFASGDGFRTQSGHAPDQALDIVTQLADHYVEQLYVNATINVPIINVQVHAQADPDDVNSTTIRIGGNNITISGLLEEIPPVDIDKIIDDLPVGGGILPGDGGGNGTDPEPEPEPEPQPEQGFTVGDEENTYAYILIHEDSSAVEVILLATPNFDGLRIVANPWFVQHTTMEGNLIDLWIRNPFQAVELGDHIILQNINCVDGECVAKKQVRNVCKELRPHCYGRGNIAIPTPDESGHVNDLPDTILHVWSNDTLHGGAGISVLDSQPTAIAGPQWQGNPFTSDGLWVEHDRGLAASLHVQLPSATHHGLTLTIGGPVVEGLTGAPVSAGADLSELVIDLDLGVAHLTDDELFAQFDPANAVLVGTWNDADGTAQGLTISDLASGDPLLDLLPNGGGVNVSIGPLGVTIDEQGVGIQPAPGSLIPSVPDELEPVSRAVAQLHDLATGEIQGTVRIILGAAGCEDTVRGCVGLIYDTVNTTIDDLTGNIPGDAIPDEIPPLGGNDGGGNDNGSGNNGGNESNGSKPDLRVDGVTVPGTERFVQWVNSRTGIVLGYVPDPAECNGSTGLDVDKCLANTPDPLDAVGVIVGIIGDPGDAISLLPSAHADDGTIRVHDGDGNPLVQVSSGSLSVAGASAEWDDDLVTLRGPDGTTICIGHTQDPDSPEGAFPSLTIGCDGLGGDHYTIQPGANYEITPSGVLNSFVLHDPADPDGYLLHYHDDGETTTISSGVAPIGTIRVPSTLVHITGDPVTSSTFGITLAGKAVDDSPYREIGIAKQLYHDGRALVSTLPMGSQLEAVFSELEPPASQVRVNDGQTAVDAFAGNAWTSGLRDHVFTVTTSTTDAPESLAVAYAFGQAPQPGSAARTELALVGVDDEDDTRTYRGTLPASALADASDASRLHFALVWTESNGPVSTSQWDDNHGAGYSYRLDMKGPTATTTAPATSDTAVFTVSWNGNTGAGAPLDHFRVQSQKGATNPSGWNTWIDGQDASASQGAQYTGAPGATHWFRTQACDAVGNCGPWSDPSSTVVAKAAAPVTGAAATITIDQPKPGAVLSGVSALAWMVDYDGDATPVVNIHHQAAGASAWKTIKSGTDGTTTWDTRALADGAYMLRFTVTDGQDDWSKSVPVTLANGNTEETLDPLRDAVSGETPKVQGDPSQAPPDGSDGGRKAEKKGSPGVAAIAVVAGVLGLFGVARRRRD